MANGTRTMENQTVIQVSAAPYVRLVLFCAITGYTDKAIRRKIEDGKWLEGREFFRSEDGDILVSMKGYQEWALRGFKLGRTQSASRSRMPALGTSAPSI